MIINFYKYSFKPRKSLEISKISTSYTNSLIHLLSDVFILYSLYIECGDFLYYLDSHIVSNNLYKAY